MIKKIIGIILWIIVLAGIFISLAALREGYKEATCTGIEIIIENEQGAELIAKEDVIAAIHETTDSIIGKKLTEFNLLAIDQNIERKEFVKEADVFTTFNGKLRSRLQSWDPIARVINQNGAQFYIDRSGKLIPVRRGYPVRTPVISGYIQLNYSDTINLNNNGINAKKDSYLHALYPMIRFLEKDDFYRAQIEQIYVKQHGEIELIPKIGNHCIVFGPVDNYEQKLNKLFVFYKQGMKQVGWNRYKTINLKFNNQVVCSKN